MMIKTKTLLKKLGLAFSISLAILGLYAATQSVISVKTAQAHIAENVLRFHVLANSDSPADQALKLTVRDAVLNYVQTLPSLPLEEETALIEENLPAIQEIAQDTVYENGYTYPVQAKIGTFDFPTKIYGDVAFPPGVYNALRIEIGDAEGQNWWCVIYPNICIAGTAAQLPESSKDQLAATLTPEEYQLITGNSPIKFRLLEWLN